MDDVNVVENNVAVEGVSVRPGAGMPPWYEVHWRNASGIRSSVGAMWL